MDNTDTGPLPTDQEMDNWGSGPLPTCTKWTIGTPALYRQFAKLTRDTRFPETCNEICNRDTGPLATGNEIDNDM